MKLIVSYVVCLITHHELLDILENDERIWWSICCSCMLYMFVIIRFFINAYYLMYDVICMLHCVYHAKYGYRYQISYMMCCTVLLIYSFWYMSYHTLFYIEMIWLVSFIHTYDLCILYFDLYCRTIFDIVKLNIICNILNSGSFSIERYRTYIYNHIYIYT